MSIGSNNEYGKLKVIVVGRLEGANWPKDDLHFDTHWKFPVHTKSTFPYPIPEELIETVSSSIYNLIDRLKVDHNVQIIRPQQRDWKTAMATHDWVCTGMNTLNMRETLVTIGNKVIECPHVYRSKHYESISYESINRLYENLKLLTIPQIINSYPSLDPKRAATITSGLFLVINLLKK